jgi:tripartite-type tricarboxylate transporter receptor subunit TctC
MLAAAALVAAGGVIAGHAEAQQYPTRSVTFIVPFPPGGVTNLVSRTIASAMEKPLGVSITVVNRSGAAGTIGTADIAKAAPDGYTIGNGTSTPLLLRPHTAKLPYGVDSFDYICKAYNNPLVVAVKKGSALDTIEKIVSYGKANPGKLKYYITSPGSLQSVSMRDFLSKAGIKAVGVPMKGDQPAIQNLLTGIIQLAPLTSGPILSNPDTVQAVAAMSDRRLDKLPDVPTMAEKGYAVAYDLWGAIVAPKGLPQAVKARLQAACKEAQQTDTFKQTMNKFNMPVVYQSGDEFEAGFRKEFEAAGRFLKEMGIKKN